MSVEIVSYQPAHLRDLSYNLGEQLKNTASPEIALNRIREQILPFAKPFTILKDEYPVGFFLLDFGDDKAVISTNKFSVLLRSLSVNPELQGVGIGKRALEKLPEFIKDSFPEINEIVLAVNGGNLRAKKLYEDLGYQLLPKTRTGRSGLQLLMSRNLF